MSNFGRILLNALWPKGAFWTPAEDDDYDKLLDGIAENSDTEKEDLDGLAYIRDPLKTSVLSDLEEDYGIIYPVDATEAVRRQILRSFMFRRSNSGAWDILQDKLQEAGFDVNVIPNSPPIDPSIYYDEEYAIQGELIVNELDYTTKYDIPVDPGYWPLFFFIGGEVTRDEYGNIINIEHISIVEGRRQALKQLVLKYKPLHSWGIMVEIKTQYLDGLRYLDGTWWLNGFGRDIT